MAKGEQKVYMPLMMGDGWFSPNTYSENYKAIPESPGVYCFTTLDDEILYVGSARNLKKRYKKHEVKRVINRIYRYTYFFFKETDDYRELEVSLIKALRPKYNYQHNG